MVKLLPDSVIAGAMLLMVILFLKEQRAMAADNRAVQERQAQEHRAAQEKIAERYFTQMSEFAVAIRHLIEVETETHTRLESMAKSIEDELRRRDRHGHERGT